MYLAGYAVECAMKALILARVPKRDQSSFAKEFRGAKYHRFAFLKERLARLGCSMPAPVSEGMRPISTWSTELRYDVGLKSYEDAKRFIDAANCICEGVKRSM